AFFAFVLSVVLFNFFFSSRRRHTRSKRDWSSDVCSSDLFGRELEQVGEQSVKDPKLILKGRPAVLGEGGRVSEELREALTARREIGRASCRERGQMGAGAGRVKGTSRLYRYARRRARRD